MITYISKKDNTTLIKLLEFNEKFKTYTVEFLMVIKKVSNYLIVHQL